MKTLFENNMDMEQMDMFTLRYGKYINVVDWMEGTEKIINKSDVYKNIKFTIPCKVDIDSGLECKFVLIFNIRKFGTRTVSITLDKLNGTCIESFGYFTFSIHQAGDSEIDRLRSDFNTNPDVGVVEPLQDYIIDSIKRILSGNNF